MVSIQNHDPSYNYTHMFEIPDLRGSIPEPTVKPWTMWSFLANNPDFSKAKYMVELADMIGNYNSKQSEFTLFVPSDAYLKYKVPDNIFKKMDEYTARQILLYNTIEYPLYIPYLKSTEAQYLNTRIPGSRLLVEYHPKEDEIMINCNTKILEGNIQTVSGVIHIVDNLIISGLPGKYTVAIPNNFTDMMNNIVSNYIITVHVFGTRTISTKKNTHVASVGD